MVLIVPRELLAYQTCDGKNPFSEWLDELNDQNVVARILARLARVRRGNWATARASATECPNCAWIMDRAIGFMSAKKATPW
jgi:hypothetical protein